MKKYVINKLMNIIKNNKQYDNVKLEEIKYGLTSIYLFISKSIIIFSLAYILRIFKEMIIFTIIYNLIRMFSFGLHATKSWICLLISIAVFLGLPYLCTVLIIPIYLKIIIGAICILLIYKNAPADTHKKPIVNKKRREVYKIISTLISILFIFASLSTNNFISNAIILALTYQCIIISPITYSIFKLPYNNYKVYIKENNLVV